MRNLLKRTSAIVLSFVMSMSGCMTDNLIMYLVRIEKKDFDKNRFSDAFSFS